MRLILLSTLTLSLYATTAFAEDFSKTAILDNDPSSNIPISTPMVEPTFIPNVPTSAPIVNTGVADAAIGAEALGLDAAAVASTGVEAGTALAATDAAVGFVALPAVAGSTATAMMLVAANDSTNGPTGTTSTANTNTSAP